MGTELLHIGKTGLFASKQALQTASHNIANANTEGFSRQRTHQVASPPIGESDHVLGTGTRIDKIGRVHDEFVEKRLNKSTTTFNNHKEREFQLTQIEEIFNEINSEGLNKILNRFFNSFRELANQPENSTVRSIVRENAKLVVADFHRIRDTLGKLNTNINKKVKRELQTVNSILDQVAHLNIEIMSLEAVSGETGDLRDQRDLAVRQLSEYFPVKTYLDDKNRMVVSTQGLGTLVSGDQTQALSAGTSASEKDADNNPGDVDIYFAARPSTPVSHNLREGKLKALLNVRNNDLKHLGDEIDGIAFNLANTVNAIHRKGFVNKSGSANQLQNANNDAGSKMTGVNFFKTPTDSYRAAEFIELSFDINDDVNNISAGMTANTPGDNRIAIAISKVQHEKILNNGTASFEEEYLKSVGNIGLATSRTKIDKEQTEGILAQTKSIRERISGVSIDEETANLIKYQHAYEASAKVMKTAEEMFQTVLNIKR